MRRWTLTLEFPGWIMTAKCWCLDKKIHKHVKTEALGTNLGFMQMLKDIYLSRAPNRLEATRGYTLRSIIRSAEEYLEHVRQRVLTQRIRKLLSPRQLGYGLLRSNSLSSPGSIFSTMSSKQLARFSAPLKLDCYKNEYNIVFIEFHHNFY